MKKYLLMNHIINSMMSKIMPFGNVINLDKIKIM